MQLPALPPNFDPNAPGIVNGNLFGLPFKAEDCSTVIIPVPWEATVSYRTGTADAPAAILAASLQVDLHDSDIPNAWRAGIGMLPIPEVWQSRSEALRTLAQQHILSLGEPRLEDVSIVPVNHAAAELNSWVYDKALHLMKQGKIVGVLGGEHSCPLGLMQACGEHYGSFGLLQLDAHADLRPAFEDFTYSHASIMYNALEIKALEKLVQVGVRDLGSNEAALIQANSARIHLHEMKALRRRLFAGQSWQQLGKEIVQSLPQQVYVSFDIDGLDPCLCPNTGTPVPDGLQFEEAFYLLEQLVQRGRRIIGFDLCEVNGAAQNEWDAIVGARVLYRLANLAAHSQGLISA